MTASSLKVIYTALAGNCLIAITKFIAALMTGSPAMFSEFCCRYGQPISAAVWITTVKIAG
jgi:divalent metal cation (Fe/Co/Zn/Cd) transporter